MQGEHAFPVCFVTMEDRWVKNDFQNEHCHPGERF